MPVSSIPFEERYRPLDPKRRKRERLTRTDRLVCGSMGGLLGFGLWVMHYMIWLGLIMKAMPKQAKAGAVADPFDLLPPFYTSSYPVAAMAIFSAIVGPEQMMDTFAAIVRILGKFAEAISRQHHCE